MVSRPQLEEVQALKFEPPESLRILWHKSGRAEGRAERTADEYMSQSAFLLTNPQTWPIPAHIEVLVPILHFQENDVILGLDNSEARKKWTARNRHSMLESHDARCPIIGP